MDKHARVSFSKTIKAHECLFYSNFRRNHAIGDIALQHRAARIITQSERSSEAMEKLKWSSLNCRRSYHKAILVYKCLHSLVPNYFLNYFKKFSNVHSYNTRHKNRLILPKVKYNFGKNTFIFSGVQVYYMLPDHVMKAESIHTFARLVRIVCNELSY